MQISEVSIEGKAHQNLFPPYFPTSFSVSFAVLQLDPSIHSHPWCSSQSEGILPFASSHLHAFASFPVFFYASLPEICISQDNSSMLSEKHCVTLSELSVFHLLFTRWHLISLNVCVLKSWRAVQGSRKENVGIRHSGSFKRTEKYLTHHWIPSTREVPEMLQDLFIVYV